MLSSSRLELHELVARPLYFNHLQSLPASQTSNTFKYPGKGFLGAQLPSRLALESFLEAASYMIDLLDDLTNPLKEKQKTLEHRIGF